MKQDFAASGVDFVAVILAAEVVPNSHYARPRRISGRSLETEAFGEERRAGETASCREDVGALRRSAVFRSLLRPLHLFQ